MKIISGIARGITLETPPELSVRPTLGRARQALFDSLGTLNGATVIDLCAGSGALGLEALSRGAGHLLAIERNPSQCQMIERNFAKIVKAGVKAELELYNGDIAKFDFKRCKLEADLIIADPPYADSLSLFHSVMPLLTLWSPGALLVWELPDTPGVAGDFINSGYLEEERLRCFGGTEFLIGYLPLEQD